MPTEDPSSTTMAWHPDPDRLLRATWIAAALFFLIAILSAIGEWRGWWDLLGELGMTIGALAGVMTTLAGAFYAASRDQASGIHGAVLDNGQVLGSVDTKLTSVDIKLSSVDTKLDKLESLDTIQWALDEQTGVLAEIRDRL